MLVTDADVIPWCKWDNSLTDCHHKASGSLKI